jgi:hypothetical protein
VGGGGRHWGEGGGDILEDAERDGDSSLGWAGLSSVAGDDGRLSGRADRKDRKDRKDSPVQ